MKKINKKGQAVLYILFLISAIIIITIAAVLAPMGVLFSTKMYTAGEGILADSMDEINAISDTNVKEAVNATVLSAKDSAATNITVLSDIFKYGWLVVILIAGVIVFLQARRLIEVGAGGFI